MPSTHGFQLERHQTIRELNSEARLFRHLQTGARVLSVSNDDENKVFGINFRTPPADSTGVAHILEHSVLCGSRKYPLKEPFVELLKGSLQTFLNAMTFPDKTCYPLASQNLQDFYNLIDVYLDAVFYPRLTEAVFQQEGWHYELDDPARPLTCKGVVFNEMKGAFSSPDNVLAEYSLQSIFPDNSYGFISGGYPQEIPKLTFEQFQAFHRNYYHPSNARIWFYGDDDPQYRLKLLDAYLKDFKPREPDSAIRLQPAFKEPRRMERNFMVGKEEGEKARGMVTVNWLLGEGAEIQTRFALRMLDYILLGMPASPLRKALIDSGLGEDIAGEGLDTELRQIYFSSGLKGIRMEDTAKAEGLVLETLEGLVRRGIDPLTVGAAMNSIEFGLRENNTGRFPRGLALMLRALTTWLYDGDPLALLGFEKPLQAVKDAARKNPRCFEELIDEFFLQNRHRSTLILRPDPQLGDREQAAERERLETARSAMGEDELKGVIADTQKLKRLQETPDPPEALASIPFLRLSDLDKQNKTIPIAVRRLRESPVLLHDLFTNGIVYLDVGFNLHCLPDAYLPYIPLFSRALLEMGTTEEDFVALTQRINSKTGGIEPQIFTSALATSPGSAAWLFMRSKAMLEQAPELLNIFHDVLLNARLDNRERFLQMVLEEKAQAEQGLIPGGHQFVALRLRSHFGEAFRAAENMGGISYLFFLRELAQKVEQDWPGVKERLERMRDLLLNRRAMIFNVTMDHKDWPKLEPELEGLLEALPAAALAEAPWTSRNTPLFEGLTIPAQVNYVGKGADLYSLGYRFHGSAAVIARYLRNTWLWEQVRVQGGAYGAFCILDRISGILTFVSYRDPNLLNTLNVFDRAAEFLRGADLTREELTKSITGAIGDLDAHLLPDAKGYVSMLRYLNGDSEEARRQMRDEILATEAGDFKALAGVLERVREEGIVKVLGPASAIQEAARERPGWLEMLRVL